MAAKAKGLGRGLDTLIPSVEQPKKKNEKTEAQGTENILNITLMNILVIKLHIEIL